MPAADRHTAPAFTGWQVPLVGAPPAVLQAWQSLGSPPPHAVSQQVPSTQWPLEHWPDAVHAPPLLVFAMQVEALQWAVGAHCASLEQLERQAPPAQA
jgi:hypothetical protein